MVDPRGGAYTVGLGLVSGLAVFPYHGRAADHLRERSVELLPADAVLVGLDEHTALVRDAIGRLARRRTRAPRPSTARASPTRHSASASTSTSARRHRVRRSSGAEESRAHASTISTESRYIGIVGGPSPLSGGASDVDLLRVLDAGGDGADACRSRPAASRRRRR